MSLHPSLHPEAQAYLDQLARQGFREYPDLGPEAARAQQSRIAAANAPPRTGRSEDLQVAGADGPLPARLYRPDAGDGPHPLVVFFHGGGWVVGDLDSADPMCRFLARETPCMVLSVNYRHAPEHCFPTPAEDCFHATRWAGEQATALGADAQRVAVCGVSAGANLAAAVALMARDRGGPALRYQALVVPAVDHRADGPSYTAAQTGPGLSARSMRWFWNQYLARPDDGDHPYASPLRAPSLVGLPPALVATAEFDPLRDEGTAYAQALAAAGVPVRHHHYAGMIHACRGVQSNHDLAAALRGAFGGDFQGA